MHSIRLPLLGAALGVLLLLAAAVACNTSGTPAGALPTGGPSPTAAIGPQSGVQGGSTPNIVEVVASPNQCQASVTTFIVAVPYELKVKNAGDAPVSIYIMPRGVTDPKQAVGLVDKKELPGGAQTVYPFAFSDAGEYAFVCGEPGQSPSLPVTVAVPSGTTAVPQ